MFRKLFTILYNTFLIIPKFRFVIVSVMGVGLGLGVSLIVFQNPRTSFASPIAYELKKSVPVVQVVEFKIPNLNISEENLESEKSEGLGINKLAILESKDKALAKKLEKVLLGEKILAIGSNNGLYAFTAIETRVISKSELNRALSFYDEGLVIFGKKSRFNDEMVLVVAR